MDEAREPLLMLAVAVSIAVYKAILYVQEGEARARADCIATRKKNEELLVVTKQQARRIRELEDCLTAPEPEKPPPPRSLWDNDDHPW